MGASGLGSRAIIGRFYETLALELGKSWVSRIGMLFSSDQESETYKWLGMVPALREWIGGRLAKGFRENGLTIVNKLFEATLAVKVDDLRRDKTGQIMLRVDELAVRAAAHWASLLSTLIANGTGSTSGLCYDGQYFFDDDHSEGASGTLKNLLTATECPALNVGTAAAPTANEMAEAILQVICYFQNYKDDVGEPFNENALEFLVMVPTTAIYPAALQAVTKNILNTGSGTRDNPLKETKFKIDVVPNARLSWTDAFAVFRTDGRVKPFILQEEEGVKMDAVADGSEHAFKNREHLYGVTAIRNVGYGLWQHAAYATLS
jgi:hypothetical protein